MILSLTTMGRCSSLSNMSSIVLFSLWLALNPPSRSAEQALIDLEHATSTVGEVQLEDTIELLQRAIAAAIQEPHALLDDPQLGDRLFQARAALAWAHLTAGDPEKATSVMDEVVRSANARPLPEGFGPEVEALYAARRATATEAGVAQFVVECRVPCAVLVNERRVGEATGVHEVLPLGIYRVWVVAVDDDIAPHYREVELDSAGQTKKLAYGVTPVLDRDQLPPKRPSAKASKRIRNLKIAGGVLLGLSGALLIVTVTEVAIATSPKTEDGLGEAFTAIVVGVSVPALLIPGGITLGVGMEKQKRLRLGAGLPTPMLTPRMVGVGWTLRF
jgi:hypothetical protein